MILKNTTISVSQSKIEVIETSIEGGARSHFDRNLTFQKVLMLQLSINTVLFVHSA